MGEEWPGEGKWSLSWVRRRSGCAGDSGQSIRAWGQGGGWQVRKASGWSGPVWGMRAQME